MIINMNRPNLKLVSSQKEYHGFINWKTDKEPAVIVLAKSYDEALFKAKQQNRYVREVFIKEND